MRQQGKWILHAAPGQRLLMKGEHIGMALSGDSRDQRIHVSFSGGARKVAIPERHVEGGVFATHEGRDVDTMAAQRDERKQHEWSPLGVARDHHKAGGAFARAVEEVFVLDLAWSSSKLEGNSLSRKQSQAIFSLGRLIEDPRSAHDDEVRMLINHKNAVEYLVHAAPNQRFSVEFVFAVHDLLMDGLLPDRLDQGRIRSHDVEVVGAAFEPEQRPEVLRDQLDLVLAKAAAIRNPVEAAFFLWIHLAYLQAFADGNKRTSRVVANLPLLLRNCAPLSFEGIDELDYGRAMFGVYERQDFSMAIDLFVHTYRRSMRKYIALLATRPRIDVRVARFRDELLRVVRAVVVERRSAAAAIAFECLEPSDAGEFGELLAERLRTLAPRHALRFDIDEPLIDSWIAAGRPH